MKLVSKIIIIALMAFGAQVSMAQQADAGAALGQIAGIVASLNHFPSDADKATLAEIAGNEGYPQGLRNMATAVANISHSATDADKANLANIISSAEAPEAAKTLARVISELNHTASDAAKAQLASIAQ